LDQQERHVREGNKTAKLLRVRLAQVDNGHPHASAPTPARLQQAGDSHQGHTNKQLSRKRRTGTLVCDIRHLQLADAVESGTQMKRNGSRWKNLRDAVKRPPKPPQFYSAFSTFSLVRKPYVRISIFIYKTNTKSNNFSLSSLLSFSYDISLFDPINRKYQ
jgi:hypothetical protein